MSQDNENGGNAGDAKIHPLARAFSWVDDKGIRNSMWIVLGVITLLLALLDFGVDRHSVFKHGGDHHGDHGEKAMEAAKGFYAFYGFGAFALVVLCGWPLRKLLGRREDYYDGDSDAG